MPNLQLTPLIDQLKLVALDDDFEKHFSSLTATLDGPSKFKVRSEVRRLTSPCARTLDLRKRVDGECLRFEHRGRIHYLDDVARDIFERGLKEYNGVFTQDTNGVSMTALAFEHELGTSGKIFLIIAVLTFAFSTMFGYSFYGRKCVSYLFGTKAKKIYIHV